MKTKNMRKKALLASVAMLLVAVLALGGATYAWFTTNVSVSYSGLKFVTGAESNLLIHSGVVSGGSTEAPTAQSDGWTNSITLSNDQKSLSPISSDDGQDFYKVEFASGSYSDMNYPVSTITSTGANPVEYTFWVKTQGSSDTLKVSAIAPPQTYDSELWNGLRVAFYVQAEGGTADTTTKAIFNPSGQNNDESKVVIASIGNDSKTYTANSLTNGQLRSGDTDDIAAAAAQGVSLVHKTYDTMSTQALITTMTANQVYKVTAKFWLEGNVTGNEAIGKTVDGVSISLGTGA